MAGRKIGEIYGEIKLKNQQFNTGLAQSQTKLQGFKMKSVAIFAAITAASYVLIRGMKDIIQVSSNLEEQTAKFGTVFRGVMDDANEAVKVLTDLYGMSTREAREHMAAIQDLLVPMGMMRKEAGNLSFEIVKLATDLGSFNNLPTQEVMNSITSALTGQYRTMRRYGIVLFDTEVRQRALNMGLAATNDELTAGDRALAAYEMMLEGSKDAQGDFIRTSDGFANSMKILNAEIEELKSTIGIKLLPILADWIGDFSELTKEITKFMEKIGVLEKDTLPALIQRQWEYTQIIERRKYYMDKEDEGLIRYRKLLIEVEKQIKALLDTRRKEIDSTIELKNETVFLIEALDKQYEKQKTYYETFIPDYIRALKDYVGVIDDIPDTWGKFRKELSVQLKTYDEGVNKINEGLIETTDATLNMGLMAMDAFSSAVAGGQRLEGVLDNLIAQIVTMAIKFAVFKAISTAMGGPAGFFMPMQEGGYVPSQLIPQVSSGHVTQPSILVGEGKGGETVVPDSRWKDMITVNVHNATPNTYVETLINLPDASKQKIFRKLTKPAMDRENLR